MHLFCLPFILATTLSSLVGARSVPYVLRRQPHDVTARTPQPADVQRDLGPQLSTGSSVYFPGSPQFVDATARWNAYGAPNISVVIEPTTADDIASIVWYANSVNLPFLTVNRGHANTDSLARCQHGIEIWMRQFQDIHIDADGKSALMGGGVWGDQVMATLDKYNKTTATGVCGCVGAMGASLGGGHGRLQGYYGLMGDQIIDANVVLANGSQVNVSATSHPDLYWALKGAGHNYGIVTHVNYKIYDQPERQWYWAIWYFTQDKLEKVFSILQEMADEGIPPAMGMVLTDYLWNTNVSTTEPVVYVLFNYAGTKEQAARYAQPFLELKPAAATDGVAPFAQINQATGTDAKGPLCVHGKTNLQFANGILRYNLTANRALYEEFKSQTIKHPEFRTSFLVFETYAQGAFKAVPYASTAYPHRADNFIITFIIQYTPTTAANSSINDRAMEFGESIRNLAFQGENPAVSGRNKTTYLNYAVGSEPLPQLYGWEKWRLERLGHLKTKYDPYGRFSFNSGIPPS